MLGLDCTRTKALTRSAMGESDWGSRISSQGMAAASAMLAGDLDAQVGQLLAHREPDGLRVHVGGQHHGVQLLAPRPHQASTCSTVTASTASARCR